MINSGILKRTLGNFIFANTPSESDLAQLAIVIEAEKGIGQKSMNFLRFIEEKFERKGTAIIKSFIPDVEPHNAEVDMRSIRSVFMMLCGTEVKDKNWMWIAFDISYSARLEAFLRIMRTIFVTGCLIIGSLLFSNDSNELILLPLENLMAFVRLLSLI